MGELKIIIEAKDLTRAITLLAESLAWHTCSQTNPEAAKKHFTPAKGEMPPEEVKQEEPVEQKETVKEQPVKTEKLDMSTVKKKVAEIVKAKGSAALKDLLSEFGAGKVSDIEEPDKMADFLDRLEAI